MYSTAQHSQIMNSYLVYTHVHMQISIWLVLQYSENTGPSQKVRKRDPQRPFSTATQSNADNTKTSKGSHTNLKSCLAQGAHVHNYATWKHCSHILHHMKVVARHPQVIKGSYVMLWDQEVLPNKLNSLHFLTSYKLSHRTEVASYMYSPLIPKLYSLASQCCKLASWLHRL